MAIPNKIRAALVSKGFCAYHIADVAGVSENRVYCVLGGADPDSADGKVAKATAAVIGKSEQWVRRAVLENPLRRPRPVRKRLTREQVDSILKGRPVAQ